MRDSRSSQLIASGRPGVLIVVAGVLFLSAVATAQRGGGGGNGGGNNPIATLKGVPVPQPAQLGRYVVDQQALVALGKALFWDMQVGSDGRSACATCHFHAGADHRVTNQIGGPQTSTAAVRPNTTVALGDFPFHAFTNPNNNTSGLTRNRRDVVGTASPGAGPVLIEVAEGTHEVEIRKPGLSAFHKTVRVDAGQTVPLNVSLSR
jgi:hypothetical protein